MQDTNYEELKAVSSSYSFHGSATPKRLVDSGKLKSEALATKCKLSLCVPCFKSTSRTKSQEMKSVTNGNETDGSHASVRYSPCGSHVTEIKSVTMENSMDLDRNENGNLAAGEVTNGSAVKIRLAPVISAPRQQAQPGSTSLTSDDKQETCQNSNSKYLEVKPSWTRTLSAISENENDCYGQKRVTFPGMSPGISPVGSPRGSVGSLRRCSSQENAVKHRKQDLSRRKRIRNKIAKLTLDPLFDMCITLCILLNTLFLSLEYNGMNDDFKMALDIGNMVSQITHQLDNRSNNETSSNNTITIIQEVVAFIVKE